MAGKRPQMKYGKQSLANIAAPSGGRRRAAKQPIVCSFSCIARCAVWLSTCHEGQAHTANAPVLQMHYTMSCTARSSLLAQGKNPPETPKRIHNGKKVTMNRVRDKQMIIRLSDAEASEFDKKMKKAHFKSRTDFIMALVRDVRIIVPESLKDITVELKKEGNNFNQTVRLWNKTQSATPPAVFTMAYRRLSDLYAQISKMLESVKNADIQSCGE